MNRNLDLAQAIRGSVAAVRIARVFRAGAVRSSFLGFALALGLGLPAQCQVVPAEQLKIDVKQGEGVSHRPGEKANDAIVVQVLNEVDLPQPEAAVTFKAEPDGPSVLLEKESNSVTVKADAQGIARIEGVRGNNIKGPVTIHVDAAFEGKTGFRAINQVNESGPILNRKRGSILAGVLATTGVILFEIFKPGPPSATINPPQATTTSPQGFGTQIRIRR